MLLTPEKVVVAPIFGWKAAKAHPRGPVRPAGQLPDPASLRPLTGHAIVAGLLL